MWQSPDEPAHYNYVRYLSTVQGFPELVMGCYDEAYLAQLKDEKFPPHLSIENICYEFHQPPLFYLLATPIFMITDGSLLALRLLSVTLGAGVVIFAFAVGRAIFPQNLEIAFGTMAFVAFVPMHLAILSSVNNDALAELIFAASLLLMVRYSLSKAKPSFKMSLGLGLLLGLALLTKATIYMAVPLVMVMLAGRSVIDYFKKATSPDASKKSMYTVSRTALIHGLIIYGIALAIALPWFGRNALLYGNFDILGLKRHDEIVVGQLRTADLVAEIGGGAYAGNFVQTTFRSFWGQFGWMAAPMDGRTYLLLVIFTAVAVGGVAAFFYRPSLPLSVRQKGALVLLASAILLTVTAYIAYNLSFVQFQGRYLFPSMIPLGFFCALGLREALRRPWVWYLTAGLATALAWHLITAGLNGGLDKWAVLILGLSIGLVAGRLLRPAYWSQTSLLLFMLCYAGLGLLALLAPFWFVVPNL